MTKREGVSVTTAWLIERDGEHSPEWLAFDSGAGDFVWTTVAAEASWSGDREHQETMLHEMLVDSPYLFDGAKNVRVTEHQFG